MNTPKPFKKTNDPKRHQLIPENFFVVANKDPSSGYNQESVPALAVYNDFDEKLEKLKSQLQTALELEHSTIPPYLCALYSIKGGTNLMPVQIIKSVVLEEMLHMIMVANLLNAIGGKPMIGKTERGKDEKFIPDYPAHLPGNVDASLTIDLTYFSKDSVKTFWKIEHPEEDLALPEQLQPHDEKEYSSIGAFYKSLTQNLIELEKWANKNGSTIFTGDKTMQVTAEQYYGAGGTLFAVHNLTDAQNVIKEIVGQGEGTLGSIFSQPFNPGDQSYLLFGEDVEEYAHYFRFKEVYYGQFYAPTDSAHRQSPNKGLPTGEKFDVDWAGVQKMKANPKLNDYEKGSPLYEKTYEFNQVYSNLLDNIHEACNGNPEVLKKGISLMYELKYKAAELMNIPLNDGEGHMAGPSFEYVNV